MRFKSCTDKSATSSHPGTYDSEFKLGQNAMEAKKKKKKAVVRKVKARCAGPKNWDSEFVSQAIETNPTCSTRRVSGEIGILHSIVVDHLHDVGKSTRGLESCLALLKYCKTFDLL